MTSYVAPNTLVPILFDFPSLGERHMSGEPVAVFEKIGVAHSQQEIWKLAPLSARLCDIYLKERGHVLFGFKKGTGSRSLRLMAHALHGDERPRCAIGSQVTHTWRRFFFFLFGGATVYLL